LVHIDGDYPEMFERLFAGYSNVEIVCYDAVAGEMPADPSECDAWVTTGSRHSVNQSDPWIADLVSFVQEVAAAGVPFVGICFGHQLLAKALGGSVAEADSGWSVGISRVDMADGESFRIANSHSEQVVELPQGSTVLGSSDHCPIAVMGVGGTMLGIQGHPEMRRRYTEALLEERRGTVIPEEVANDGVASMSGESDAAAVADVIVRFLRGAQPD
jgi:GMP synthase (glutamine-hydrolysing)